MLVRYRISGRITQEGRGERGEENQRERQKYLATGNFIVLPRVTSDKDGETNGQTEKEVLQNNRMARQNRLKTFKAAALL